MNPMQPQHSQAVAHATDAFEADLLRYYRLLGTVWAFLACIVILFSAGRHHAKNELIHALGNIVTARPAELHVLKP